MSRIDEYSSDILGINNAMRTIGLKEETSTNLDTASFNCKCYIDLSCVSDIHRKSFYQMKSFTCETQFLKTWEYK